MSRWLQSSAEVTLLMMLGMALLPESAWATIGGGFSCSGGHAHGMLYDDSNGFCPPTMKFSNVFSFLICHTEQLSANLLGGMFCGVISALMPAVTAAVTLAVLFAGIGFTLGFTHATAKDFQAFLLKVAVVYAFATQADLLIGIGYSLLVGGLRDGVAIAVGSLYTANGVPTNGLGVYALLDGFLAQALHFATDAVGQNWAPGQNPCKNAVFAVLALMAVAFPPMTFIGIMLMFRIAITFVRAIFGYLYSIIGITFLLTLAPFFLSFYLFKQTQSFFEKWLGYLVSFSLQMVIVFAFLSFVLSIKVDHITSSFTDIIMPVEQTKESTTIRMPWEYCSVCKFDVVDKDKGVKLADNSPDFLSKGKLQCRTPKEAIFADRMMAPPDDGTTNTLIKFTLEGLLSLVVLAYVVDALLGNIPSIAQRLASGMNGQFAPAFMGGGGNIDMPGGRLADTFEQGFSDGFQGESNSASGVVAGFKKATERLVNGGGEEKPESEGLVQTFKNFLINPQRGSNE